MIQLSRTVTVDELIDDAAGNRQVLLVASSARRIATWLDLATALDDVRVRQVRRTNGDAAILLHDGGRIRITAPSLAHQIRGARFDAICYELPPTPALARELAPCLL